MSAPPKLPELPKPSSLPPLDERGLAALYEKMAIIRRFEELAAKAYTQRKIRGFCHLYIGEESVAVGAAAATRPEDWWIYAYRDHGHAIAKGVPPRTVMAELYGKATGCSRGQGGSMHLFDREHRALGGFGIVGGHVPLANGVGWTLKHKGEGGVCFCFFGDGAANQGAFFEALCIAQLYKLPVVFICENNFYAMGTPLHRQSALSDMSLRALGVGMVREQVDGFDVVTVRDRVGAAADFARAGNGPVLLEVVTYRYYGHSMSDPAKYRSKEEVEERKTKSDPLRLAARRLREEFGVSEEYIEALKAKADRIAQDAVEFAEQSPEPDPATLFDYVYTPPRED